MDADLEARCPTCGILMSPSRSSPFFCAKCRQPYDAPAPPPVDLDRPLAPALLHMLRALHAVGPCDNATLARALGIRPRASFSRLCQLRRLGLAARLGPASFGVTVAGKRALIHARTPAAAAVPTTPCFSFVGATDDND